jgi:hypothetical protein
MGISNWERKGGRSMTYPRIIGWTDSRTNHILRAFCDVCPAIEEYHSAAMAYQGEEMQALVVYFAADVSICAAPKYDRFLFELAGLYETPKMVRADGNEWGEFIDGEWTEHWDAMCESHVTINPKSAKEADLMIYTDGERWSTNETHGQARCECCGQPLP